MENSKRLPQVWMLTLMFITLIKKGLASLQLNRHLGLSRFEAAFRLMHIKIRDVMGGRDDLYFFEDMVEYDRGNVIMAPKRQGQNQLKPRKGSPRQAEGAVESKAALGCIYKAFSNLKMRLLGIYHKNTFKHLKNYLYKFINLTKRRFFGEKFFERFIIASIHPKVDWCGYTN